MSMVCLVVEGTPAVRESLCYVLLSLGIKGVPAANRQEALDTLKSQPDINLAIVDLDSKEVQGEALLSDLREACQPGRLQVIVQSVQSNRDLVARVMEYGVAGYLVKPYQDKELYEKLKKVLERCQVPNERRRHIRVRPDPDELLRLHFKLPSTPGQVRVQAHRGLTKKPRLPAGLVARSLILEGLNPPAPCASSAFPACAAPAGCPAS